MSAGPFPDDAERRLRFTAPRVVPLQPAPDHDPLADAIADLDELDLDDHDTVDEAEDWLNRWDGEGES